VRTHELTIGVTSSNSAPFFKARLASVRATIGLDPPFALGFTSKYWRPGFKRWEAGAVKLPTLAEVRRAREPTLAR
jgi:hypothetical protein